MHTRSSLYPAGMKCKFGLKKSDVGFIAVRKIQKSSNDVFVVAKFYVTFFSLWMLFMRLIPTLTHVLCAPYPGHCLQIAHLT